MSTSTDRDGGRPKEWPPGFGLESTLDDPENPEAVTLHPGDPEDPTTEWLTIDAGFVLPIEETV